MKRFVQVVEVKPNKEAYYRALHGNPWPGVLKTITDCNIRNYSIYFKEGYAFAYYEYIGDNYEGDMAKMAKDPIIQKWWDECKPCLYPIESSPKDACWTDMEEVFYYK